MKDVSVGVVRNGRPFGRRRRQAMGRRGSARIGERAVSVPAWAAVVASVRDSAARVALLTRRIETLYQAAVQRHCSRHN